MASGGMAMNESVRELQGRATVADLLAVEPLRDLMFEFQDGFAPQNFLDYPHALAQNGTLGACTAVSGLRSVRTTQARAYFGQLVKKLGKEVRTAVVRWILSNGFYNDAEELRELPRHYLRTNDTDMLRFVDAHIHVSFRVQDFVEVASTISSSTFAIAWWQWMAEAKSPVHEHQDLMKSWAEYGRLDLFRAIHHDAAAEMMDVHPEDSSESAFALAVPPALAHGHTELVDWLLEQVGKPVCVKPTAPVDVSVLLYVVSHPLLQIGQGKIRSSTPETKAALLLEALDERAVDSCCIQGDVQTLRWLLHSGKRGTPFALKNAVAAGQLDAVNCVWAMDALAESYYDTSQLMDTAIANGNIEICQYLDGKGFTPLSAPATAGKLAAQAKFNPVAMLEWVERMGGVFEQDAMDASVASARVDSMRWLYDRGLDHCRRVSVDVMCLNADLAAVKWVCEHLNQTLSLVALSRLARDGKLEALQYAVQQGAKIETGVVQAAQESHHYHVLRWLQRRAPQQTQQSLRRIEHAKHNLARGLRSTQYVLQERALQRQLRSLQHS